MSPEEQAIRERDALYTDELINRAKACGPSFVVDRRVLIQLLDAERERTRKLREMLAECVPPDIELACDNCGDPSECPDHCYVRRARALIEETKPGDAQ